MSSQIQKSASSSSSSSSTPTTPEQLIALPSLSCQLSSLPNAKSVDSVSLHPTSMSAQRAAESEAKLRKALSKSAASHPNGLPPAYVPTSHPQSYSPSSNSPPLMMRKPIKQKIQV
ncbi:hypothetical protein AcW1_009958 [Taiwanofungus camphoratus]|nr:hypothetical protein AcV5_003208 [Antrodia cinnamomea]KAI0929460.1 hypothetical protein AcV7_005307 [Antrodia cinnamomea]KAI0946517.1 hypothetical protein AcW1_009958 [Antrodia cinnamomea]